MSELNTDNFNSFDVCRVCLLESSSMKDLLQENSGCIQLRQMYNEISNIKIEKSNGLPSYLCVQCEEKLGMCFNFHKQCEKSNTYLQEYIYSKCKSEKNAPISDNNEASNESNMSDNVCDGNDSDYDPSEDVKTKKKHSKQTMRLAQYSYDLVTEAIEKAKKKFHENTECIQCGFIGSNSRALSVHMSHLHKELKDCWCSQCNAKVPNLQEHLSEHGNEDLKCQFCDKVFSAKGHLTEHLRSHSGIRPFKCTMCEKGFISSRHLRVHCKTHSNSRPFKCPYCPKKFIHSISWKKHLKVHSDKVKYDFCHLCDVKFETAEEALMHIANCVLKQEDGNVTATPTIPPQNFCNQCNKKVRSLNSHLKQYHKEKKEQASCNEFGDTLDSKLCTVCGKQFKTSSKLKVHMRVHTGEAPYKCGFCDRRFGTRNQLVVHERTHTGEKPHICSVCGKRFAQSSVLNTHMRLHTGRPELCKICGQRFCRPAELRLHMRKHTGEKPFLCTECGQAFIQRSHLMEHVKIHSDERPYQCPHCERGFKQSSSLKSHIQIHLGCRPYRCSQCSYACRQSYSLTLHMKQHVSDSPKLDKPYACSVCQKSFSTIAMLNSHGRLIHHFEHPC